MRPRERWPAMRFPRVVLRLPDWVEDTLADRVYPTVEDRMRLAVELSRLNVRHGTGGPFGAAIFERETGELLAPGVNLVIAAKCSVFHAEMVAIMVAQRSEEHTSELQSRHISYAVFCLKK